MLNFLKKIKYLDVPLLAATVLLLISGLTLLYSSLVESGNLGVFYKQLIIVLIGLIGFSFLAFFNYHSLSKANKIFYVILILVLLYLLFFGTDIRGGRRWIDFGFFVFQPAEFIKFVIILGLARLLYLKRGQINSLKILIWSLAYTLIPAILVVLEPDLGSSIVLIGIWAGIILISPIKKKALIVITITAMLVAGLSWQFALEDFQRNRIKVFINPSLDPKGIGYNVKQATIAIGSGQFVGRGLGKGFQGQNKFLPERQTDFIFASSGEEIGFLGSSFLLALYFYLLARILRIASKAKDNLGFYVSVGAFFLILIHVLINIGMNMALLPVTGIPLPLLSLGGSSIITTLAVLGVVQNVAMQSKILRF